MSNKKPTILWCWWYDRKDLLTPLLPVMAEAENHFLFYRFPEQEQLNFDLPGKRHYWTEYSSPYHIIKSIRPDKVVFMGIENMLSIALLSACRKKNIGTYYLAHGLTIAYENTSLNEQNVFQDRLDDRYQKKNFFYTKKKGHTLLFYLHALFRSSLKESMFLTKFAWYTLKTPLLHKRLYNCRSRFRLADKYIVITWHLARLLRERDNLTEDRIIEVGPYSLDYLFPVLKKDEKENGVLTTDPYFLLIDQPLPLISEKEQKDFLKNLADALYAAGYHLKIKLHPRKYQQPDQLMHVNITWARDDVPLALLIKKAAACLGYFSALLLPLIWFKPCGIFNPFKNIIGEEWIEMNVVKELDYRRVEKETLEEVTKLPSASDKTNFKKKYLFEDDGRGVERIQKILINQTLIQPASNPI